MEESQKKWSALLDNHLQTVFPLIAKKYNMKITDLLRTYPDKFLSENSKLFNAYICNKRQQVWQLWNSDEEAEELLKTDSK